ncbi:hypothetical protein [Terasakiella sp. SH-1]|uniref:hypothetical protein n=1 Tax=Terasakiella sp. SH-1 TaxID=2560057 RepID=UPI0010746F3A|nr:hypothetical protein [Terasakiella sp. SH-1]
MSDFVKVLLIVTLTILGAYGTALLISVSNSPENFEHIASGIGVFLLPFATLTAALVGVKWFQEIKGAVDLQIASAHKKDKKKELQFELANQVIDAVYEAQNKLQEIRSPAVMEGERETIINQIREQEGEQAANEINNNGMRLHGAAGYFRWNENRETYLELQRLKKKFGFIFGSEEPIETILHQWRSVRAAAIVIAQGGQVENLEWRLWEVGNDDDEVYQTMNAAITQVEELCGPVLRDTISN